MKIFKSAQTINIPNNRMRQFLPAVEFMQKL